MKKICFALLALLSCSACDEIGNNSDIFGYDPGKLNQVFTANQAGEVATFQFVAVKDWNATVSFPSEGETAGSEKWLTVAPDHGDGGRVAMSLVLNANETGKTRTAQVNIACGSAVVPLLITQKAEKGEDPDSLPSDVRWLVEKIVLTDSQEDADSTVEIRFTYDEQNRLTKLEEYDATVLASTIAYAYQSGSVTETWNETPSDTETIVYTLDAGGRIVSWKETGVDEDGDPETGEGRLEYDGNRLIAAFTTDDRIESVDNISWDAGNIMKITHTSAKVESGTDFTYGNELNNPAVNLDLNYLVTDSELLKDLATDSFMIKAMGYIGVRSTRMIASEKDFGTFITGETVTYRYTTDSRGLITRIEVDESDSEDTDVYEITYREIM